MKTNIIIATLLSAVLAGCGASQETTSSVQDTVDSRGYDVTVLQAWISDKTTAVRAGGTSDSILGATYRLDPSRCNDTYRNTTEYPSGVYTSVRTDCTQELEWAVRLDGGSTKSPLINNAQFEYEIRHADNQILTRSGKCELVEFRTIVRDVALNAPTFKGIGFHFSGYTAPGSFVSKEALHAVGRVVLKDGAPATVHRFVALGMCFGLGGNGGSLYRRNYDFRPYAQYEADANSYRIWDEVPTNYLLGRTEDAGRAWVQSFDRQGELLRQ